MSCLSVLFTSYCLDCVLPTWPPIVSSSIFPEAPDPRESCPVSEERSPWFVCLSVSLSFPSMDHCLNGSPLGALREF